MHNRNGAITAAVSAAAAPTELLELAEVISRTGDVSQALKLVRQVASNLNSPNDVLSLSIRSDVIARLVALGDPAAAEALADVGGPSPNRIILLGKLGAAYARAHDEEGAQRAVEAITRLAPSSAGQPPGSDSPSAWAYRDIGLGLVAAGQPDDALRLTRMLSDGLSKVWILARSAELFCRKPEGRLRGRDASARSSVNWSRSAPTTRRSPPSSQSRSRTASNTTCAS